MKTIILTAVAVVFLLLFVRAVVHNKAIRNRRCPKCGAPILPISNGIYSGYRCTECEWWEITDDF